LEGVVTTDVQRERFEEGLFGLEARGEAELDLASEETHGGLELRG
jgi:hypothetical protein